MSATAPVALDARVVELLEALVVEVRGLRAAHEADRAAPPALLTQEQVAALLQMDVRTLRRLELAGDIPRSIKIGNAKRWRRAEIDKFLGSRRPA